MYCCWNSFLASCQYHRRGTSRYRGHKIKTKWEWHFTYLLRCPTGRLLCALACGWYRKIICRSVHGFRSTDNLNFLFSLGIDCLHDNSISTTIQTVMHKEQFLYPKFNTSRAIMALWINYHPKKSTQYFFITLSKINRFKWFGMVNPLQNFTRKSYRFVHLTCQM